MTREPPPLPTPAGLLEHAIRPAFELLPEAMRTFDAARMVLAICVQESGLRTRWQITDVDRPEVKGRARGFAQFEPGGVVGVVFHQASRFWLHGVCKARCVPFDPDAIYAALEHDDVLAMALARLLLFTDRRPIPHANECASAWDMYVSIWKPGKPHPDRWPFSWETARGVV